MTISHDGRWLASAGEDTAILLINLDTREQRRVDASATVVHDLAFSPNDLLLASAGGDGTVRLIDVTTGGQRTLGRHDGDCYSLAFSPARPHAAWPVGRSRSDR